MRATRSLGAASGSVALLASLVIACSSSSGTGGGEGSGSVSGTENGAAIAATNSIALFGTTTTTTTLGATTTTTKVNIASVAISNRSDVTCSAFIAALESDATGQSNTVLKNVTAVSITVASANALAAGTFKIQEATGADPTSVSGSFGQTNATCQSTGGETATTGSIVFTELDSAALVGTYDLTFPSGAHLTGSFSAPSCPFAFSENLSASSDADAGTPAQVCE